MSSTSDRKSKFFFVNCLHCDGIIRIPIAIRPGSDVTCPHCDTCSNLYDLMDQIPEAEVGVSDVKVADSPETEDDATDVAQQENGKFIVPNQLASGIKKRRRRRRRSSSSGEASQSSSSSSSSSSGSANSLSEAEENRQARKAQRAQDREAEFRKKRDAAAAAAAVQSQPIPPKPGRRSRPAKPKRSPVVETLKIVIGGMVAAPVAYLLLLWVFSRDPLGIAPTINSFVPALVPEWVVGVDEGTSTDVPTVEKPVEEDADEVDDFFKNLPVPEFDPDDVDSADVDFNDSADVDFNETVFD